jgi:hypothetical protein
MEINLDWTNALPRRYLLKERLISTPSYQSCVAMTAGIIELLSILNWRSSLILALAVTVCTHYIRKKKTPSLPPGPRGLPFVGNVLDVPTTNHWLKFAELGNAWGMSTLWYILLPSLTFT